jgi:hypothetical protein
MYLHQQIMKTRQDDMLRRADRARLAAQCRAAAVDASQPAAVRSGQPVRTRRLSGVLRLWPVRLTARA